MEANKEIQILIADDEVTTRNLLASILRDDGYRRIDQARDGSHALAMLGQANVRYDVAFLDIDMPGHTGLEVMRLAKPLQAGCRFVMISGHSAADNVVAALNGGAAGFIVKPYNARKIHDILSKLEREHL
jgi:two-component system chemotaxis response regulator CheY